MRDLHMRHQSFRVRVDQLIERVLIPRDEALRRLLALDFLELFRVVARFGEGLAFSISNSGPSAMTKPSVSKPIRPARPAI